MSDLIQMEMSLDEARETDRLIKRHINTTRYLLLDMRDRQGWKALGYESFKEYGKQSLGYEKDYLYKLADAGEISIQIGYSPESTIVDSPPESQLRPLKAVPEEERKAIWEEATRKAEEEHAKLTAQRVQEAVAEWKQRNQEWAEQSNGQRQKINELKTQVDLLKSQSEQEPIVKEVFPSDYESAKQQAASLQSQTDELKKQIDDLQKQQSKIVSDQVKAKLQERQNELNKLERDKEMLESVIERHKASLASLSSEERRIESHCGVIERQRLELVSLAAFLSDLDLIEDKDTRDRWLRLSNMHNDAHKAILSYLGLGSNSDQLVA